MSTQSEIFGYIHVGAAYSEARYAQDATVFNKRALSNLSGRFWTPNDFRFATDSDDVMDVSRIAITKFTTIRPYDVIMDELVTILRTMHFAYGLVVNHSIDRSLIGDVLAYDYDLRVADQVGRDPVQPVGDALCFDITARSS